MGVKFGMKELTKGKFDSFTPNFTPIGVGWGVRAKN